MPRAWFCAGHNAFYRARGRQRTPVFRYLVRDFPAAVVQSWAYVFVALMLFAAPAGVGYGLIRAHPEPQDELVSPVMVSRARQAAENHARGIGHAPPPKGERPRPAPPITSHHTR